MQSTAGAKAQTFPKKVRTALLKFLQPEICVPGIGRGRRQRVAELPRTDRPGIRVELR